MGLKSPIAIAKILILCFLIIEQMIARVLIASALLVAVALAALEPLQVSTAPLARTVEQRYFYPL